MVIKRKFNPERDLADLSGKVIIVTGANTGIGYSTVKHLARKGAKVYLGARSEERGKAAVAKLKQEGIGSGQVIYLHVDISTPALAHQAAQGFLALESRLDVLVNNAAIIWDGDQPSAQDGIPEMMMTNHIGTFQFTKTLLPTFVKTAEEPGSDVRIITVASEAQRRSAAADPNIQYTLETFKNHYTGATIPSFARYSVSKLANTLFANALARRLASAGIISLSLHPGLVNTSLATRVPFPRLTNVVMALFATDPDAGAYTSCFAAGSPVVREEAEKYNGSYLHPPQKITAPSSNALNIALQDQLWETTEEYLKGQALVSD